MQALLAYAGVIINDPTIIQVAQQGKYNQKNKTQKCKICLDQMVD